MPETDGFALIAIRLEDGGVLLIYNVEPTGLRPGDRVNRGDVIGTLKTSSARDTGSFQLGLVRGDAVLAAHDLDFLLWPGDPRAIPPAPSRNIRRYDPGTVLSFEPG